MVDSGESFEHADGKYVNLANARNNEQKEVMELIAIEKVCPFCPDNLHTYHKQPIISMGEHWVLTPNQWPYDHTRTHLLAIAAYHAETLDDLRDGSFEELGQIMRWASEEYAVAAGGIALRFGDATSSGATVRHLHAHLIEPDPNREPEDKVRFKIS